MSSILRSCGSVAKRIAPALRNDSMGLEGFPTLPFIPVLGTKGERVFQYVGL